MTAPTRLRRLAGERGQSLVLTLLVLFVLAIVLSTVIIFTSSNQRNSNYQKSAQVAGTLAEAGANNAISILSNPANAAYLESSTLMPSSEAAAIAAGDTKTGGSAYQPGTTVTWWGNLNTASEVWTLTGKATVPNPTGPTAAAIVKTVTATVQVEAPKPTNYQVGVWNAVYSPAGPTAGCDTSIGQGVTVNIPLYVGGNLCMGQNASVTKPVWIGGYLYFANKQATIGSSGATINSAHVGGYCQVQNNGTQVNPCKSEPQPNGKSTNIWVTGAPNNLSGAASDFAGFAAPAICWNGAQAACTNTPPGGWYSFASPGPLHPCATSSGTPPTFDTGDGLMNQSVVSTFNLTPAASYTCTTSQGQISWNAATKVLTVVGTIFIDGSITFSTPGNNPITYTGTGSSGACTNNGDCQAVIYASGDISVNSEKLCAVLNNAGNDCNWNTWDPNKKMLVLASNGTNGITVGPSQTSFQGALYATNAVSTGQSAVTEGPLVSGTKTVILGQQFGGAFPPITIAPLSIQESPGGFYIDPPSNFSYSG